MELNLSTVSYEGRWFDFGGGRLKIRPQPGSKSSFLMKDGAVVLSGEQQLKRFMESLEAWEGFVTPAPEHAPITLTDEVKRKLFDFRLGTATVDGRDYTIAEFVLLKADEMADQIRGAGKN